MAVEVIDTLARQEITDHETGDDPHAGVYLATDGSTPLPFIVLISPGGKLWKLTVDDDGILSSTDVTP